MGTPTELMVLVFSITSGAHSLEEEVSDVLTLSPHFLYITAYVIVISSNNSKTMLHRERPVGEETVVVIYLSSISTALVDKFRTPLIIKSRRSWQNLCFLKEDVRSQDTVLVFILSKTFSWSTIFLVASVPEVSPWISSDSSAEHRFDFPLEVAPSSF